MISNKDWTSEQILNAIQRIPFLILALLKLTSIITWPWIWVFCPLWIVHVIDIVLGAIGSMIKLIVDIFD